MNEENTKAVNKNVKKISIKEITVIGLMTAIICVLGPLSIPIPFSVVPISLTNLVIFVTVLILGCKKGTFSYLIYLLIGFAGLPVFSGFSGGPGKLVGPTGGYLIGFIFLAVICGIFADKYPGKIYMYVIGMVLGMIITYTLGTAWLAYQLKMTFVQGLFAGVIPYLPGDILKMVVVVIVGPTLRKNINKAMAA